MRLANLSALAATSVLAIAVAPSFSLAQDPSNKSNNGKDRVKLPPDEFKAILNVVEEAYKAPREVDKDILDEVRKQYRNPTPEREARIFREIRRLYVVTADREQAILKELKRTYEQPTPEQEDRLFGEIRRGGQLPLGTVSLQAQSDLAARLFAKLDQDRNGSLNEDEQPEALRQERGKWDRNLDGLINLDEYLPYYQASLKSISAKVASGEIYLKAAQQDMPATIAPTPARTVEEPRPRIARVGKLPDGLPDWFAKYDLDRDGQVGLYEWVKAGKPVEEFLAMDRNGDGLLEAAELLRYLAAQAMTKGKESSQR